MARHSTPYLQSLRAHWADQLAFERERNGGARALKAADVVKVIDEVLQYRRDDSARSLLNGQIGADEGLAKILDACSSRPTELACGALRALRDAGWSLICRVDNSGLIVEGEEALKQLL